MVPHLLKRENVWVGDPFRNTYDEKQVANVPSPPWNKDICVSATLRETNLISRNAKERIMKDPTAKLRSRH